MRADDWPAPQVREVFSHNRNYFVRVIPGNSFGDTYGFKGAAKGSFATAEFYRLDKDRSYRLAARTSLLNPVAPIEFFVTDRGALITLDNWHNMGYGKVVAFYSQEGKVVRDYALADLFTQSEVDGFRHSESSIWWRSAHGLYIRPDGHTLNITTNDSGAGMIFDASGGYQYCETRQGKFLCREANRDRAWRAYREPSSPVR